MHHARDQRAHVPIIARASRARRGDKLTRRGNGMLTLPDFDCFRYKRSMRDHHST